jgi:hypothetical protein
VPEWGEGRDEYPERDMRYSCPRCLRVRSFAYRELCPECQRRREHATETTMPKQLGEDR